MNNEIDIAECRAVYAALRSEGSALSIRAGRALAWAISQHKPKAKDRVKGQLDPRYRAIIQIITPNFTIEDREAGERNAWDKIKGWVEMEHIESVAKFYKVKKAKEHDATWNRKTTPTILMNAFASQYEMSVEYNAKHDTQEKRETRHLLPEPTDWKSRVTGALPNYTWDYLCKQWPHEAKALQATEWRMERSAEGLADLTSLLNTVDREVRLADEIK